MTMMDWNQTTRRGNMAIETVVILAIVAMLTLIAFFLYGPRAEAAREEQARREVRALAEAEMKVAETHQVFVPLQMLDDLAGAAAGRDDLGNAKASAVRFINPEADLMGQIGTQLDLNSDDPHIRSLAATWAGPFHHARRIYYGGADASSNPADFTEEVLRRDYPLDPWGTPYRFFSPIGIIGTAAGQASEEAMNSDAFSDGALTTLADRFDGYAIVSYGPNRVSDLDPHEGEDDDIIYIFSTGAARESMAAVAKNP